MKDQLAPHEIEEIIRKLTSELYFHGHPINRQEAREDVGLSFVANASDEVAELMWDLFLMYDEAMRLSEPFQPIQEALALSPLAAPPPPPPGQQPPPPSIAIVPLPTAVAVLVESSARCSSFESHLEVTLMRDHTGAYNGQLNVMKQAWRAQD